MTIRCTIVGYAIDRFRDRAKQSLATRHICEETMARVCIPIALLVALAAPSVVRGHHSTAMFEPEKRVTLTGTVKEFQWTNPHAWIQLAVTGADGKSADWSFECGSPNTLSRQGWKPSTLKMGEQITVVANPMKDGTNAGLMYTVTLTDGRVLGPGAPTPPAAAPAATR